jgi:hypothetical protein
MEIEIGMVFIFIYHHKTNLFKHYFIYEISGKTELAKQVANYMHKDLKKVNAL